MLSAAVATLAFTLTQPATADLSDIKSRGVMKVATEDNYAPFNFMENGQAKGFNADMLKELKQYAPFSITQEIMPWTGLLAAVSSGQYDMALTGALVSTERLRVFNFTIPYASAQDFYVKRADDDSIRSVADLSGKKLGVQAGSVLLTRLPELKAMLDKSGGQLGEVVKYQSYPEAYADLANGRLDYVINAEVPVNTLVKARPDVFSKGQAVSGPGFVAWPVPKSDPELLKFLDQFMTHMKQSGRLAELQKTWFGEAFPDLPQQPITEVDQFRQLANLN
ncbi:amino acid ABC transporter substrate-binding protein [Kushneria phosphatilytica]|uniref:Transporter substrate-binding domain-containing protein n=2 Tax=Kushneria phosphatilytica TaxID=657387 RepID=A0A1S1NQQ9_9GAMM|nr:amino acid ABC transporter substrate-binding protein [Kushneria phosphatilytica]QEL12683.1 transporter substrate-binding domain-containing protein [Kushneria phosphatilytica]